MGTRAVKSRVTEITEVITHQEQIKKITNTPSNVRRIIQVPEPAF